MPAQSCPTDGERPCHRRCDDGVTSIDARRTSIPYARLRRGERVGDYEVERLIASGGFGSVYEVVHPVLCRAAALKVLHPHLTESKEAVVRFQREARAANLIRHPNIVDIHGFGRTGAGAPYMVMELLRGADLEAHVREHGRLNPDEVCLIAERVAGALDAAHEAQIIHRDIKPSNVFIDDETGERRVVLLDFGVAKLLDERDEGITTSMQVVGTPSCMSPEQFLHRPVDSRSDVYALGGLLYHLLTGRAVFEAESYALLKDLHLYARRPLPSALVRVPAAVDEVITRALSIEPANRPGRAGELARQFADALHRRRSRRSLAAAVQPQRGVGVHVSVRIPPDALAHSDSSLRADMTAVVPLARACLAAEGLVPVVEAGNAALFVRLLPADDDGALRSSAIAVARRCGRCLADRSGRHPSVAVSIVVHVDAVTVVNGRIVRGPLLRTSQWEARRPLGDGVYASEAAIQALALDHPPILVAEG